MAQHTQLGIHGENVAVNYLLENNYKVLHTNWRLRKYEIDIIAHKNNTLIFVEVKTRTAAILNVNDVITSAKQKQLINALHHYCMLNNIQDNAQIDILLRNAQNEIEHIQDAFR
jgi:putative endonuclease